MTTQMAKTTYDSGEPIPYVDSRIYSDQSIFEEELEKIWKRVWLATVHESEIPEPLDFRTMTVAREPIVIVRGSDNKIRAFLNVCPHRGNLILRQPSSASCPPQCSTILPPLKRNRSKAMTGPAKPRTPSYFE